MRPPKKKTPPVKHARLQWPIGDAVLLPEDSRPLPVNPLLMFGHYRRWITAIVRAQQCTVAEADCQLREEIVPVLREFPANLIEQSAPQSILVFMAEAGAVPIMPRVRTFDLFAEALVRPQFEVTIRDGDLEISQQLHNYGDFAAAIEWRAYAPDVHAEQIFAP